jgi:hypothetical protein
VTARALVALILASASLAAGPSIRWIDDQGVVRRAALHSVEKESAAQVAVRLETGQALEIEGRHVVDLRREDPHDADQRALLDARRRVARYETAEELRETLDRLAGKEGWVGEHAAAWRAVLAVHAREEDAEARLAAFLEKHGTSRLACDVLVARAWLRSRGLTDPVEIQHCFTEAYTEIGEMGGPLAVRFGAVVEASHRAAEEERTRPEFNYEEYARIAGNFLDLAASGSEDYAAFLLAQDARVTIALEHQDRKAALQRIDGHKPWGVVAAVERMRDPLLLPQTRSAIEREVGQLREACGDAAGAGKAYEAALADADEEQRPAIEAALARVKRR